MQLMFYLLCSCWLGIQLIQQNLSICVNIYLPLLYSFPQDFLCQLLSFSLIFPSVNNEHFKVVSELPGNRICRAQTYIRVYSIPATGVLPPTTRGQHTLQMHQNKTFKRLHVISINSWTLRNQQCTLSCETDFDRGRDGQRWGKRGRERGRDWAVKHKLSFIPSHYIPASQKNPGAELTNTNTNILNSLFV